MNIFKWLYNLGAKNERRKIHQGLLLFVGDKPQQYDLLHPGVKETQEHLQRRIAIWNEARQIISDYFSEIETPRKPT